MVFGLASVNVKETDDWKKLEADIIEESIASNESAVSALRDFLLEVRNASPTEQSGGIYQYEGIYGWIAGGGIPVLNTKDGSYVALIYRDEGAPTYPNTFTITSGLSESWKEMTNLRTLSVRETIEELMISIDDERWARPQVSEEVLTSDYVESIVSDRVNAWQNTDVDTPIQKYEDISVSSQPLGSDSLTLSYGDETKTVSGHFVIDSEYNMIDMIDVIHFDLLDYSIDDLQFYDGEMVDGEVLDRHIHLVKLSDIDSIFGGDGVKSRFVFQSGDIITENGLYDDPVTLVGTSSAKSLDSSDVLPMG